MKTPEEIKKGLAACKVEGDCDRGNCPYYSLGSGMKCIPAMTADALAYIQELEAKVPKWISVEERLPEDGQKVLVCGTRKGMQVGTFRGLVHPFDARGWWWKKGTRLDVTHWMPLPESLKEGGHV